MQTGGTGTIRQNRLHRIPIISKKDLENKNVLRGTSEVLYKDDQTLVAWKDSKAVYMASNKHSGDTDNTCKRFDRVQKKSVQVSKFLPLPPLMWLYYSIFQTTWIQIFTAAHPCDDRALQWRNGWRWLSGQQRGLLQVRLFIFLLYICFQNYLFIIHIKHLSYTGITIHFYSKDTFPHQKVVVAHLLLVSQCQRCPGLAAAHAHYRPEGAVPGLYPGARDRDVHTAWQESGQEAEQLFWSWGWRQVWWVEPLDHQHWVGGGETSQEKLQAVCQRGQSGHEDGPALWEVPGPPAHPLLQGKDSLQCKTISF